MHSDSIGSLHKVALSFGNDKSRIIRGIAVILMVTGHCLPGKVNVIAVPLYTFLVGYGYNFATQRSIRYGLKRIWKLLKSYWLVIFGICLPVALISYPHPLRVGEIVLSAFGLDPLLNSFNWYIYFYIFAMMVMPVVSRLLDKPGKWGIIYLLTIWAFCGLRVVLPTGSDDETVNLLSTVAYRCMRRFPVVMVGYYVARHNLFAKFKYYQGVPTAMMALAVMIAIYFIRGWQPTREIDAIWAPLFSGATAILFGLPILAKLKSFFVEMGMKSMWIWFIHALFFTQVTKGVFDTLIDWIPWSWLLIVFVLTFSYLVGALLDKFMNWLSALPMLKFRAGSPILVKIRGRRS